jgi:flagellin-like protein
VNENIRKLGFLKEYPLRESSKGLSPIVAVVLLIAFVLAVGTIVSPFLTGIFKTSQQGVAEDQERVMDASSASIEIISLQHNNDTGNLTVTVENTGSVELENISVTVYGDELSEETFNQVLDPAEVAQYVIQVGGREGLDRVEVTAANLPVRVKKGFEEAETGSTPDSPTDLVVS